MVLDTTVPFVALMAETKDNDDAPPPDGLLALYPSYKMVEWACKRYSELIPCSYASGKEGSLRVNRTDEQILKWRHIVDTCKAIDMDPERTTFIARPVSAEFC